MRLPRMTTRRWMVAVAAIGLLLGATISIRRYHVLRHTYLERAAFHEAWKAKLFATPESPRSWESRWSDQRIGVKARKSGVSSLFLPEKTN